MHIVMSAWIMQSAFAAALEVIVNEPFAKPRLKKRYWPILPW